jgi:hypothetical protein
MVIFRSMNGRSGRRMGGQTGGPVPVATAEGDAQFNMGWGWTTPAQRFRHCCRHLLTRLVHDRRSPKSPWRIATTRR